MRLCHKPEDSRKISRIFLMLLLKRLKTKAVENEIKYITWRKACLPSGEGFQGVSYYMKRTLCKLLQDQHYLILSTENLLHFLAYQNRGWYTPSLWFIHLELRMLPLQEAWFPLGCMFFLDELPWNYLLLLGTSVIVPSLRITCTPTSSCHIHEKFWNFSVQSMC